MDEINTVVRKINGELYESRHKLQSLEKSAEKTIKAKVEDIKTNLKKADHLIENVREETSSYLRLLEDVEKAPVTVNMQTQMVWLHDQLGCIIRDFDAADLHARNAAECTDQYIYKIMDIKQEVEVDSNTLAGHQSTAKRLLAQAEQDVKDNETRIRSAVSTISSNESSIQSKKANIQSKTENKAEMERRVAAKQLEINRARAEQRDRKAQAIGSGSVALLGVLAAPFTFGASLAVTAAAGGAAVYKAVRMDEFEAEANSLQQSVNTINSEISSNRSDIVNLESETRRLQTEITTRRSEIVEKREELKKLKQQISSAEHTSSEISEVKDRAGTISNGVSRALPDLRGIRSSLVKCSDLIRERSSEASYNSDETYKFLDKVPMVGTKLKRKKDFKKQIEVVREVLQSLEGIHKDMPSLMPVQSSKLLDIKPWNSANVSTTMIHQSMPEIVYFSD